MLWERQDTKSYLGGRGDVRFGELLRPFVLGAIRDASSGYTVVLWVLVGLTAALFAVDSSLTPARLSAGRHGST